MSYKKKFDELVNELLSAQRWWFSRDGEIEDEDGDWLNYDDVEKIIKKYDPNKIEPKPPNPRPIGAGHEKTIVVIWNPPMPEGFEFDK